MNLSDAVNNYPFINLVGSGGAGKTTHLKNLVSLLAEDKTSPVPLYVDLLTRTRTGGDLLEYVLSVADIDVNANDNSTRIFEEMAKKCELLLLIDGVDEIKADARADILRDVQQWAENSKKGSKIRFVVASRTELGLKNFHVCRVSGLSDEQVAAVLERRNQANVPVPLKELLRMPLFLSLFLKLPKDHNPDSKRKIENRGQFMEYFFERISEKADPGLRDHWRFALRQMLPAMAYTLPMVFTTDVFWQCKIIAYNHLEGRGLRMDMDEYTLMNIFMQAGMIARTERGEYRFVHHSIWEFLQAESIADDMKYGKGIPESLTMFLPDYCIQWLGDLIGGRETEWLEKHCFNNHREEAKHAVRNIVNVMKSARRFNLRNSDFTGLDLSYTDLHGTDLTGSSFRGASFSMSCFENHLLHGEHYHVSTSGRYITTTEMCFDTHKNTVFLRSKYGFPKYPQSYRDLIVLEEEERCFFIDENDSLISVSLTDQYDMVIHCEANKHSENGGVCDFSLCEKQPGSPWLAVAMMDGCISVFWPDGDRHNLSFADHNEICTVHLSENGFLTVGYLSGIIITGYFEDKKRFVPTESWNWDDWIKGSGIHSVVRNSRYIVFTFFYQQRYKAVLFDMKNEGKSFDGIMPETVVLSSDSLVFASPDSSGKRGSLMRYSFSEKRLETIQSRPTLGLSPDGRYCLVQDQIGTDLVRGKSVVYHFDETSRQSDLSTYSITVDNSQITLSRNLVSSANGILKYEYDVAFFDSPIETIEDVLRDDWKASVQTHPFYHIGLVKCDDDCIGGFITSDYSISGCTIDLYSNFQKYYQYIHTDRYGHPLYDGHQLVWLDTNNDPVNFDADKIPEIYLTWFGDGMYTVERNGSETDVNWKCSFSADEKRFYIFLCDAENIYEGYVLYLESDLLVPFALFGMKNKESDEFAVTDGIIGVHCRNGEFTLFDVHTGRIRGKFKYFDSAVNNLDITGAHIDSNLRTTLLNFGAVDWANSDLNGETAKITKRVFTPGAKPIVIEDYNPYTLITSFFDAFDLSLFDSYDL